MNFKKEFLNALTGSMLALVVLFNVLPALAGSPLESNRYIVENPSAKETEVDPRAANIQDLWRPNKTALSPFGTDNPILVPAAGFVSDGFQPDSFFFPFGGGYFQGDADNYGCMEAPVYFPDGATIGAMHASVYDNDPARGISFALRRVDNFAGGTDTLGSFSTSAVDAFAGVQILTTDTITPSLVTYPDYSYYVTTCLGSGSIRLYAVWFDLPQEVSLPIIFKVHP